MDRERECTDLEWTRDGNEAVRAEVLQPHCIDGHEIHDITGGASASVVREDQSFLVDHGDQTCADTHTGLVAALEVL